MFTLAMISATGALVALLSLAALLLLVLAAPAMASTPSVRDASLKVTRLLPASTSAVTSTSAIDTGKSTTMGTQIGDWELLVSAPAVTTTQLPDAKTFTYDIIHSDNADLSAPATLHAAIITQTGAAGAGAAAATARRRIPSDAKRYIGLKVTPSASGTGDASAATATMEAMF
jgi:hypothetical protein